MATDRKASSLNRVWVIIHRNDLSSEIEDKSKSVPRCVILPQESPTPEIQDIFRVSLALQDENLVMKLRNNRGSLIPINGFITPNSKFQPYVLEVTRRYQNVKPMKRSVKINGYNDIIKQRLQQIVKRIDKLEQAVPEMKTKREATIAKGMTDLNVKMTFLNTRMHEAESTKWQGMFKKHPLW
ncbi:uncharacterized protein LOC129258526 [Lytechinus pictus]|uniref:uncharacterized protein LOC121413497 n=1 Tax=Lytechinus variegatus TaxID=7654 RepID=UPI001BB1D738|nr:uncharacterized protein LOC121413497 [Lytechinus variegatus]XP_041462350.1 uncharacterized protein LOC121413558 [Lytechinus variegatus]XP_054752761.1 uncharacterized protein LOC129258526 [Lytechinus pictus]